MKTRHYLKAVLATSVVVLGGCQSGDEPAAAPADAVATEPSAAGVETPTPPAAAQEFARPILEQALAYGEGAKDNLVGYLAMPGDAAEPLPGIVVIHEANGLDDHMKGMARRLAAEGYVVLAVDLYGGATAATPEQAQALMSALFAEPEVATRNLQQAYDYLEKYALAPRIASVGWDLGAGYALQMALLYPNALDAAVIYYGQVVSDRARLATITTPILGFFGEIDASTPVSQVLDFRAALRDLGKNADIRVYPRVNHTFVNPNDANYDAEAASESWDLTLAFLSRHLKLDAPTQ